AVARLLLADAYAFRVVAVGAEGAGASRAYPLAAALVAALLLFQPLLQRLHQLLPAAQRLDQFLLVLAEVLLDQLAQPLLRNHRRRGVDAGDALEVGREYQVVAVEELLVLDQAGAGEMVEVLDAAE